MQRKDIINICDREVLDEASRLYGVSKSALSLVPGYEGCANLVYEYERDAQPRILRISFRPDRTVEMIKAELHFVNYLAEGGVQVAKPLRSENGKWVETLRTHDVPLHIVSFARGKGMRVPDNGYRYREDAPIEEYFRNWGGMLGRMHALAKTYHPANERERRPDWFALHEPEALLDARVPESLPEVHTRIRALLEDIRALPKDHDTYGLIHGDFNDGNFTVDYSNGDITAFDFDDSCYFWFIYELASAWEGGIGRVMFRGLDERKAFMERYMDHVMEGYNRENTLPAEWLARLPLFLKLIQVEEFLHFAQYLSKVSEPCHQPDEETRAHLNYLIKCITDDIPYLGFFDSIYSPEKPFLL